LAEWEAVIGMEVHVQLTTRSKMFCRCPSDYLGKPPNSNVCPICLGMPGVLPVINAAAVEQGVRSALALDCTIAGVTKFDRKNYFYPDIPKGFQISQYDLPMSREGGIEINGRRIGITRVHLEEDTGRLAHAGEQLHLARESYVDLNRSGMPLMEIVSEPDLRSAEEARDYAMELRSIMRAIGASEADMEKGQLRAEANVSVRRAGSTELGVKTELKNINSFRALQRAIDYEVRRQVEELESGRQVVQETRGWSEAEQRTFSQRSKEHAHDYRYFPEPDLPPLELSPGWVEEVRRSLPELPAARRHRLSAEHGLSAYDAGLIGEDASVSGYFEAVVSAGAPAKQAANWIVGSLLASPQAPRPESAQLARLIRLVTSGQINREQAQLVLQEMQASGRPADEIVSERGLAQVSDEAELAALIDEVIAADPKAAADYRAGKQQAIGALLGQVRQRSGGKANLALAGELMRRRLSGSPPAT
jgi:aspartyl-tRNA(Asn)/glutamyl-tRNA(Gln) amidotransferase subunit B